MTNKTVMLPCPFCGSTDIKTVVDDGIHFEQCCKCEATGPTGFKRGDEDDADWNTRAAPAEDVRAVGDERSQKDCAIEHAEYMATAADYVSEHFNAYGLALFEFDESDADDDRDMLEAIDSAREDLQESMTNLRHMVYEFRKRRARAIQQ
ncbi:MAG TPA: hypothetical protein VGC62_08585 [Pseudomonas sp.]|uniref:hypothetical protein n=1 Tax=Pseudomonas sp. TaxID=306 RepID=UPI002EDAF542